ncbi:ribosome biogenesis protein WDR12 homolog [Ceratitis capitata]|uniref:ribosome biogenesis protein WDR12 homolog n=1 Tax=Ceratitis capitata TaxID=7213 RepID=UPI0003298E8D|nr:ribosome biogenesis protein WDR12 homolog [Ceratitis capitata]
MEAENGEGQVQVRLKTKQEQYAVPDVPYTIEGNVTTADLNTFVNTLLEQAAISSGESNSPIEFDFIVIDEYLRGRLCDHLREKEISFEDTVDIEYVERFPAPEPQDCLLHDDWVSAVKACDKWILTGCYDNTINIWTVKGKHVLTIPGHTQPLKAVAWVSVDDESGKFVSCSQDQTAMLWEWRVGTNSVECVSVCKGHERGIDCVDVSPDKFRFATGSWDTMLKIWSAEINEGGEGTSKRAKESGTTRVPRITLQGHRESISSVQWMDSSTLLTSSWDHTLKIWDLHLEGIKSEISANKSIFDASYSNLNHLIVTASADKNLRLYDPRTNQGNLVRNTYFGHSQWVQTVMWSTTEEYLFISGSYDNQNKLWDYRSPKAPLYDLLGHGDKVLDIDWSNPKYIVSGGADNTVRVFKSRKAVPSERMDEDK